MSNVFRLLLACFLLIPVLASEFVVRYVGLVDFPCYAADRFVGYQVAPNQAGVFLNKNRWFFNDKGMGTERVFQPQPSQDVLVIGDSIVLGGNPLDQPQKLGPQLTRLSGVMHWPVAAGSWALANELAYLKANPDVVAGVSGFAFVLNSADFGQASSWACELTHPREKPTLALWYVFRKYVLKSTECGATPSDLKVPDVDWRTELKAFASSPDAQGKPMVFWLYPTLQESQKPRLRESRLEARGVEIARDRKSRCA